LKAREAIVSSPINRSEDLNPMLEYAPPRARERTTSLVERLPSPVIIPPVRARNATKFRPEFSGDRAMLDLQRQLALNPDIIPEPSPEGASVVWPILLRLGAVSALAAAVAWGVVTFPSMKKTTQMTRPEAAAPSVSLPGNSNAPNSVKLALIEPPVAPPQPMDGIATASPPSPIAAAANLEPTQPAVVAETNPEPAQPAIAATPSQAAPPEAIPPQQDNRPALRLEDTEITTLVKRGKDLLNNGDLASARLLLRRAADGGSPEGALALAATYDPRFLQRLGAIGATPDIAKAREWYQRAIDLGSTTASQQLARLDAN
jgi:hypothetical protein